MIPGYDLDRPDTWTVMPSPYVDPSWVAELTRIGGLNPFGDPNLRVIWAATHRDEMAVDGGLKYWICTTEPTLVGFQFVDPVTGMEMTVPRLADVPPMVLISVPKYAGIDLGERCFIVEIWRSPAFLENSGRYKETMLFDAGRVYEFRVCQNCEMDAAPACVKCESCGQSRFVTRDIRTDGEGQLLRDFPRRGHYDFLLRLENVDGEAMELNALSLTYVREYWYKINSLSDAQKRQESYDSTFKQRILNQNADNPRSPFQAPTAA